MGLGFRAVWVLRLRVQGVRLYDLGLSGSSVSEPTVIGKSVSTTLSYLHRVMNPKAATSTR